MRVFLDDERATPEGWVRAYWPDEVIALLEVGGVEEVSLDHDLGDDDRGTGYDVVLWIEEAVALRGFVPPRMRVHSANSSAREKMEAGIRAIERLAREETRIERLAREETRIERLAREGAQLAEPDRKEAGNPSSPFGER